MAGMVGLFITLVLSLKQHVRLGGNIRRGVPIWKDQAPAEQLDILRALESGQHEKDWGWVEISMDVALLYADLNSPELRSEGRYYLRRTSWPYVLHVDLRTGQRSWRIPLAMALFVVPHACAFAPFIALVFYFNHRSQKPLYDRAIALLDPR